VYQGNQYSIDAVNEAALDSGLIVSLVTIQQPTGEQTADGSPLATGGDTGDGWNNVAGLINLQCMNGPEADARIRAKTNRDVDYVEAFQFRHLFLPGYYPQIEQFDNWRAIVDGQAYDPIGVETDSQFSQTRLLLQLAGV
jgi:hypothetical protein